MASEIGGRLFFTNQRRSLVDEDEIVLTSVGIDIGSSTSHLAFSRLVLERADTRYVVAERKLLFESDILLTPYRDADTIDTEKLDAFFNSQYRLAHLDFADIDTGALILTGTAVRRRNARAIGQLFSEAAGKFVSVSAGDEMEAVLAAYGSGAVARSKQVTGDVLNVDIGGGTAKLARCAGGQVIALTAMDVGARVLALDAEGRLTRLEPAAAQFAAECGVTLNLGAIPSSTALDAIAQRMAARLMQAMGADRLDAESVALLRLEPLPDVPPPALVIFSGGVSEYIYERDTRDYGDLGPRLARAMASGMAQWGVPVEAAVQGIRATVIGASQYTVQVSGSTIFVSDMAILPLRNLPTIKPVLPLESETPSAETIAASIRAALARLGAAGEGVPVALCYDWPQSATFQRMDAFCRGAAAAFAGRIGKGMPLVLVGNRDIGGLIGLHFAAELGLDAPIISIDGVELQEFDFIDIGAMFEGAGAVPVVIKSLVFPATGRIGRTDLRTYQTA